MKTKYLAILLAFLFSIGNLNAQSDTFDLADYRLPDFNFKSLDLNAEFKNSTSFNHLSNSTNIPNSSNSRILGFGSLNYNSIQNDRIWQRNTSIFGSFLIGTNDFQNSNYRRDLNISSNINFNQQNRKYIRKNFFREINYDFQSSLSWREIFEFQLGGNSNKLKSYIIDHSIVIPIKLGKGRLEQVTDARQAIFILERLKKEGRLKRSANKEDIKAFAEIISKLNYRRYFDFRLRKIYELEQLDSFLQNNNLISNTDIKYFAHLNDMWNYGGDQIRFSGNRISLVYYPGYKNRIYKSDFPFNDYNFNVFSSTGGLEYSAQKPINLYWHNEFEMHIYLGGAFGKQKYKADNRSTEFAAIPKFTLGLSETLFWYPNTRTSVSYQFGIEGNLIGNNLEKNLDLSELRVHLIQFLPSSNLNFNYFINPRFQIEVNFSTRYKFEKRNGFSNINIDSVSSSNLSNLLYYPLVCNNLNCDLTSGNSKLFSYRFYFGLTYNIF